MITSCRYEATSGRERSLDEWQQTNTATNSSYREKDFGARPFLRLAGGKQGLASRLVMAAPQQVRALRLIEPFLGGGSLFMALQPDRARLNDLSHHLMAMYRSVRDEPAVVHQHLLSFAERHGESFYYSLRSEFNDSSPSPRKAAQLIYLNRACYNGVFRVNRQSRFNVPWGKKQIVHIPTSENLQRLGASLTRAELWCGDFRHTLTGVGAGDFVYLDPPYPPTSATAFFRHYTAIRFSMDDQRRLAVYAHTLAERGAAVMVSNADMDEIRDLFHGWNVTRVDQARSVTSTKDDVKRAGELVITSY